MGSRDSRRILGPEKSVAYSLLQPPCQRSFLNSTHTRTDGRSPADTRKHFLSVGLISEAKGSSYVEAGNTKVCCGVYGPRDVQRGSDFKMSCQVVCQVKMSPFSCPVRLPPASGDRDREMSRQLKNALESVIILDKFPKSEIDVYITVVEDGGGLLAACVTAAGLALAHANIDMYDIVVGASVLYHDKVMYVDPSRQEEEFEAKALRDPNNKNEEWGQLTVGMMPKYASGQVALMIQSGQMEANNLVEGLELATDLCTKLYNLVKKTLLEHVEIILKEEKEAIEGADT
ncbi:hypothetical protein Pcinc_038477 [Petrolisthes cinctipes]|uniref:Exoribonuclease phosphorolytic domain-containing protein n=1 Tax=Petrolisthes cinctipes TaxID=88211 RepID=A0AAE1EMZ5_PETCI|nr:hypothetical protein Pcinc_038477 [Petrolisthes cinctipes]